ncbi:hypothetical protein FACS1894199_02330 [Bacteroidia bacterium]|nr:hypothetical protein FACS1894199_02330 [Bacteroidia bacterium]
MILSFAFRATAQDIEALAKAPYLTTNGGLSLSQIATFIPGDTLAPKPYAMYLAGNLNFNFLGVVDIPLSFSYSNQQLSKSGSLPFNRFSIAPSYKWVKVYAGYTSMQFSPYSLAGHELFGGGIELTPDNGFKISALYGRLKKATAGEEGIDPAYKRMGGGFNVEYKGKIKSKDFDVGISLFKAQDMISSARFSPDSVEVKPQDNLTGSVKGSINVIENLRWGAEYGFSAMNRDISQGGQITSDRIRPVETNGDLAIYHALKTNVTYTFKVNSIGATYERIAPNYTTLGAYYMTNDYENITANFATAIKKLNIALNGGYQHDNLDKQKHNEASRVIYAIDLSSNVTEKLSLGLNLSNMQSYVFVNDVYSQVTQTNEFQNLDTLNVTQLNYTVAANAAYTIQNTKEQRQSVSLNVMYQKSAEAQQFSQFAGNDIYNISTSYQFGLLPLKLNSSASVNFNYNQLPESMYSQSLTYSLSVQKTFFEDLQSGLTASYSDMSNQDGKLSNVLNIRLNEGYILAKRHNLSLMLAMLYSDGLNKKQLQYSINLAYNYTFNVIVSRKDKKVGIEANF